MYLIIYSKYYLSYRPHDVIRLLYKLDNVIISYRRAKIMSYAIVDIAF